MDAAHIVSDKKLAQEVRAKALNLEQLSMLNEPALVQELLPILLEIFDDKSALVRNAAEAFSNALFTAASPHATAILLQTIAPGLRPESRWRTKLQCLRLMSSLAGTAPMQFGKELASVIPALLALVWDTKSEVSAAARGVLHQACAVISNRDIIPFLPALESALINVDEVAECIHALASTTFVQTIDCTALAVIVPLLVRGFGEKRTAIKRQCTVIVINMLKLVEDPEEAAPFLPELLSALQRATEEISEPEAREVAGRAHAQLIKLQKAQRCIDVPAAMSEILASSGAGAAILRYISQLCSSMVKCKAFREETVNKFIRPYLDHILPADNVQATVTSLLTAWGRYESSAAVEEETDEGEVLADCKFTLAYGSKVLLHNTELKLIRGKRYGLLGGNDSGKSTLLRAIANYQVDGFPPASEVRTVLVEADIQGEMSHLACLDYVYEDPRIRLSGATREEVARVMGSVGFTEKMLKDPITSLSGGWRMKLALARAMLQNADVLLLDEPTNHLDVINVAWVQGYLNSLKDVTSIIVSHDSGLLDRCCTHILQIDNLKLHTYRGNLTAFVERVPAAMSYFKLSESRLKFRFPQPGYIEGVKSKGKALMKMDGVAFTYPGNDRPTISGITVQVSLSSRVACVGVNGAGKSTMIKLLTGQLEPGCGTVWKHPNCRVAYVAQHAFHHIEKHLNKSANEYIRWRYESGEDKEGLEKVTLHMSAEEMEAIKRPLTVDVTGADGKTLKQKRVVDRLTGSRRQGKRGFEYEVTWVGLSMEQNMWLTLNVLEDNGFSKLVKALDAKLEAREGMYARALTAENVERHLEDVGLDREFATHYRMSALSGGQKVKVVLAAAMWNQPHILILDEPTNYLDRDSLGALAGAIREYEGGVVMITHNNEFCSALCPETWVLENGRLDCKGDAEWMANAARERTTEFKAIDEMVDANGNVIQVKQPKRTLTRKERMMREKRKKIAAELGETISSSDED